jgi:hypothetical protein
MEWFNSTIRRQCTTDVAVPELVGVAAFIKNGQHEVF